MNRILTTTTFLAIYTSILSSVHAAIILEEAPYEGLSYDSKVAMFGQTFADGREYEARLQHLKNDPYLCNGKASHEITRPLNGSSVVLLAQRGECDYETKGRVATDYGIPVHYVIVYDNIDQESLVTMMVNDPRGINVGMLFTYKSSGEDLLTKLDGQTEQQKNDGGLFVLMDAEEPYVPYIDPYGWIGGIFMMITCCSGILLCCQAGYIRRDGSVIIVGRPTTVQHSNLMTREQVMDLPTVTFLGNHHRSTAAMTMATTDTAKAIGAEKDEPLEQASDNSTVEEAPTPASNSCSLVKMMNGESGCGGCGGEQHAAGAEYNTVCSICLEDFEYGEQLRVLPCRHQFHTECILPWLTERQGLCPLCKVRVLPDDENTEDGDEASIFSSSTMRSSRINEWVESNRSRRRLDSRNMSVNMDSGGSTGANNGGAGVLSDNDEERLRSPLLLSPSEASTIVSGV
mmetsp:Transcript_17690/g.26350  ORF Transcript_17690/g.26350 Transcript_17690/m.26350 type:complete len:459 (-) Transcript_17690:40-1416(-)